MRLLTRRDCGKAFEGFISLRIMALCICWTSIKENEVDPYSQCLPLQEERLIQINK